MLRTCREACGHAGRVIVVERVLASANEGLDGKLSDLNMLVSAGGRERTPNEFERLFNASQFSLVSVVQKGDALVVMEAKPV